MSIFLVIQITEALCATKAGVSKSQIWSQTFWNQSCYSLVLDTAKNGLFSLFFYQPLDSIFRCKNIMDTTEDGVQTFYLNISGDKMKNVDFDILTKGLTGVCREAQPPRIMAGAQCQMPHKVLCI